MLSNKLTAIPAILRLSLCLLVSAGIHGGVAYYDWASQPSPGHDGQSAIAVKLVSAEDTSSPVISATPETPPGRSTGTAQQGEIAPSPPTPSSPPFKQSLLVPPTNPVRIRVVAESVETPPEDGLPADRLCVEPDQILPGPLDEVVTITGQGTVPLQGEVIEGEMPGAEGVQRGDGPAGDSDHAESRTVVTTGGTVNEAMPNYRSNPLPKYPSIARQRHWEGVVWLLVDVSAKGLVEDVELERSCGYRVLDRAASRAVKRWEFAPATRAGLPVESQVRIPVRFSLEDS